MPLFYAGSMNRLHSCCKCTTTLNFNSVTTFNDRHMAAVIRASTFSRLKTFKLELSGTDLLSGPMMFEQVALLLKNTRCYAVSESPITKFLLSSTGLGEPHFRRILEAGQHMPRLMDPTGPWNQRPDVAEEYLEMRLEMLNVNVLQTIIRLS